MYQSNIFTILEKGRTFKSVCSILGIDYNSPAWPDKFGTALSTWIKNQNIEPIRTLSLFSGAGGLDIGFSDVGFKIVDSVEIEKDFCKTLELNTGRGKHFEDSIVHCKDIREFSGKDLQKIDFIIGGPPCQTFSAAGRRANGVIGLSDERGVLFREYVRLLEELSPKGFLFENVYGIIGAQGGKAWHEILNAFSEVGYKLFYRILDAADYGVPQHRERLLIVGLREGVFQFPRPTHGPDSVDSSEFYNAKIAIDGVESLELLESNRLGGRYANLLEDIPPGLNYSFYTEEMGHPNPIFAWRSKFSDFLYKADPNTPVRTIKASSGAYTGPLHWDNRFFNLEEYKRLQTFPDDYSISGKKQIAVKQIGNSVPPQLARILAIAIRMQVFNTSFPFELSLLDDSEVLTFRKRKRELTTIYREKALEAIKKQKHENTAIPKSRIYYASINNIFNFKEMNEEEAQYKIQVEWTDKLNISVRDIVKKSKKEKNFVEIKVLPQDQSWTLVVNEVILQVKSKDFLAYTAVWKAFEHELITNNLKADLVQLRGYYQYTSKISCISTISKEVRYNNVLKKIIEQKSIPSLSTTEELSVDWDVEDNLIPEVAEYLKTLGYEIRNHSTNPQIAKGSWLIPYQFPTLSPLSVQLWKSL